MVSLPPEGTHLLRDVQGTSTPRCASTSLPNSGGSVTPTDPDNCTFATTVFDTVRSWSPRLTIRVDTAGEHTYAPTRMPSQAPEVPWALYLADSRGRFRLLCLDFDDRQGNQPGAARRAAEQVSRRLHQLDTPHLLCASGGRHSRHLWIRLAETVTATQVRSLAAAFTQKYKDTFDASGLLNPTSGCARAPGSPHRYGAPSQPLRTAGRNAADALAWADTGADPSVVDNLTAWAGGTIPASTRTDRHCDSVTLTKRLRTIDCTRGMIPGTTRPLPEHIRALANTAPTASADTSRISWSIMLSAAHAHWSLDDITAAALTDQLPGLEHLRTESGGAGHGGRRTRKTPHDHIAHQWERALNAVAAAPATPKADVLSHARKHVRAALAAAENTPFFRGSAQGFRRWAALAVIADLMYRADSTDDFELDVRRWAIAAATTKTILAATVWELIDAGWLVRTRPHSGPKAAAYRLVIPAVQKVGHKVTHPLPIAPEHALERSRAYLNHLGRDVWQHHKLGPVAAMVHWTLSVAPELSRARLRHTTGVSIDVFEGVLTVLTANRLIHRGQAVNRERVYAGVAGYLGVAGMLERRQTRYRRESKVWAWWCSEIEWRAAPATAKPSSPVRDLYGRFPTYSGGHCDWSAAMRRVAAVETQGAKASTHTTTSTP